MKSVKSTLNHLPHVLIASHTITQSGQWAWVNHDPSFTQTGTHARAK